MSIPVPPPWAIGPFIYQSPFHERSYPLPHYSYDLYLTLQLGEFCSSQERSAGQAAMTSESPPGLPRAFRGAQ